MSLVEKLNVKKSNEFETFELDKDYPHLIISKLDNGITCIHNSITGENFFNSKTIQEAVGLAKRTVNQHISNYQMVSTKGVNNALSQEYSNSNVNDKLTLKLKNSDKPVAFYPFKILTYVVFRSNKAEAIIMRDWIENALNEKFNKDNNLDIVDMEANLEMCNYRHKKDSEFLSMINEREQFLKQNDYNEEELENLLAVKSDVVEEFNALTLRKSDLITLIKNTKENKEISQRLNKKQVLSKTLDINKRR